jgi:glycosyltransferase involved in cell wall biosynthesis
MSYWTPVICFLSSEHPPFDKRVFDKEARSLAAVGYEVVHLCAGDGETKVVDGVTIRTYVRRSGWWGRFVFLPRLYRLAADLNADCYHCNEVDSWLVGIWLKLLKRKPVIFDVHEHYPSNLAERFLPRFLHPLGICLVRFLFCWLTTETDRIVLAKSSLRRDFRGCEQKQVLAQNYPVTSFLQAAGSSAKQVDRQPPNGIRAVHLGLINRVRGWPQLLEALARSRLASLRLHVIGTFSDGSREEFLQRAAALGLLERIDLEEWLPFGTAFERLLASDIGLVLFQPGRQNHVHALPHKIFDYMMAGLPVVAPSFAEEVAYIVRETECGLLVDPSNPDEIAEVLDQLARDASLRRRLGENGRRAVLEKYNWEAEAGRLIQMYDELFGLNR